MVTHRRTAWLGFSLLAGVVLLASLPAVTSHAQWFDALPGGQFELSEAVEIDQVDNAVRLQMERVKALLADRQWDEVVESLRRLAEAPEGKLVGLTARRYVGLRDWCQGQLASLPPDALKLYRARVDPVARQWYDRGIAGRDRELLENVVDRAFASSYGDRALLALGDMALESGDYAAARAYWERIVPAGNERSEVRSQKSEIRSQKSLMVDSPWPSYPDTNLDLAAVRARLVLASILEGEPRRARAELAAFARLHPQAQGRLGGRQGNYVQLLQSLLDESDSWPAPAPDPDWPTFAGNPQRNKVAPALVDVGAVAWRFSPLPVGEGPTGISPRPVGEGPGGRASPRPPPFHPVLVGDLLLVNNVQQILAVRPRTGKPAWGQSATIYKSELAGEASPPLPLAEALGTPQYTMTVFHNRLYARMGPALTGEPQGMMPGVGPGYLVCLDLASEGRLLWKTAPEEGWSLEGSPLADRQGVYVAMRRHDVRPQAAVACFDAGTGRLRWRRQVCAAETPARGMLPECTHNLLTLSGGTIYCNTNLGAVAALRAEDGRTLWLSLYPRALRGDLSKLAPHWRRELNPCLVDRGTLLVAPADSPRIFAFDAATGAMLWQTGTEVEDATGLLGAAGDWLLAGGPRLYWISLREEDRGRVKHVWPDGPGRPGYGRGLLAGDCVLWPTRDKLYVFDRQTAQQRKVFDLAAHGAAGGNLLVAGGGLLIATENALMMLGTQGGTAH